MPSTPLVLLLGDQLFAAQEDFPERAQFLMIEDIELATRFPYHKKKLVFYFSAMRHTASELGTAGAKVHYRDYDPDREIRFEDRLAAEIQSLETTELWTYELNDQFLQSSLIQACERSNVVLKQIPSPAFLTPNSFWNRYLKDRTKLRMADFYAQQRKSLSILIDPDGKPVGGKWSFDTENRKRLPKSISVPCIWPVEPDSTTQEVIRMINNQFADHWGDADGFKLPVTKSDACRWLDDFLETRIDQFGDYEDAISAIEQTVFHSLLAPLLNCGLLTPRQVLNKLFERHARQPVPLNALEGFLRQLIGWREFIRGVEIKYGSLPVPVPQPHQTRKLGPAWYEGTTGLVPLDETIRRVKSNAWCHHIERLMILGSAMLMCDVDPVEAYRWFMVGFIDGADWVMAPNVYGMALSCDGNLFATKPYFSGSAYLKRMSDYPVGDWCDTWDALFWRYVDRQRQNLLKNPRMSVLVHSFDKFPAPLKQGHHARAIEFIERVTTA